MGRLRPYPHTASARSKGRGPWAAQIASSSVPWRPCRRLRPGGPGPPKGGARSQYDEMATKDTPTVSIVCCSCGRPRRHHPCASDGRSFISIGGRTGASGRGRGRRSSRCYAASPPERSALRGCAGVCRGARRGRACGLGHEEMGSAIPRWTGKFRHPDTCAVVADMSRIGEGHGGGVL